MSTVVNNAMCRCCSAEGAFKNIQAKYNWMGQDEVYLDMIKDCFDIKLVLPEDFLFEIESGICEFCITQLRNALHFRKQVLATEDVFKKRLAEKTQISGGPSIKMETVQAINNDDVDALDFDMDENDDYGYEVPVKEEKCDPTLVRSKKTKRVTRSNTKNKKSKTDEAETSKSDSESDKKLHQKVKHLIKKKSVIKIEKDDDWSVSINKKADPDDSEPCSSIVGTVVKFLKPTVGEEPRKITIKKSAYQKKKKIIELTTSKHDREVSITAKKVYEANKHLKNLILVLKHSNATPIRRRDGLKYKCSFCESGFTLPRDLKTHTIESHDDDQIYQFVEKLKGIHISGFIIKMDITDLCCNICGTGLEGIEELLVHLEEIHEKNVYLGLRSYIVPFRFEEFIVRCVVCAAQHDSFKLMSAHMNKHMKNFTCKECGLGFVNKKMMQTHCYRHKKGEYQCENCPKVFDNKLKMQSHNRAVHYKFNKRNKCSYCGEMFTEYVKKVEHEVSTHGARRREFQCNACTECFSTQKYLTRHIKKFHLMEKR